MQQNQYNVLVVDDEEAIRKLYIKYFSMEEENINFIEAPTGNKAFEIIENTKIDFVISDIKMPDGNGIFLLEKIRRHHPHSSSPPLVLVTGYSEITRKTAQEKGALELFGKPVDLDALLELMRTTIHLTV